jgi:hypothetical protein
MLMLCVCASACVASAAHNAPTHPVLELTVVRTDGTLLNLGARDRATLLFLFATYDGASQLMLTPLTQFVEREKRITVVGVALQPDAKAFLDLYQQALAVPFQLYFDPENRLLQGRTALGRVRAVPCLVALDALGRIRAQHYGAISSQQLRELADSALGD